MFSRKLNSNVSYPFIPEVPNRDYIQGIQDIKLFIVGAPSGSYGGAAHKPYYAFLYSLTVGASVNTYGFIAVSEVGTVKNYFRFTFEVPWSMGLGTVQNMAGEECRGVLIINATYMYKGTTPGDILPPNYELEPGVQMWLEKQVITVNFANEYRDYDLAKRGDLPNTHLTSVTGSADLKISSGYNMSLSYDTGLLTLDGNAGNGLGVAPDNMWDAGPSWDTSQDGLICINGIAPNANGDIPMSGSATVAISVATGNVNVEE
jgi:hypothetical protein